MILPAQALQRPAKLPGPNEPCWCGSTKKYKKCHRDPDEAALRARGAGLLARRIKPGKQSPRRVVPAHIPAPDYARTGKPGPNSAPDVKDAERLARHRKACQLAAQVLFHTGQHVRVGITSDELDALCHEETLRLGAYPSPLNYHGFPKSLCTSVNEVICHGIPDDRPLEDGDIVNLDVSVFYEGMHGDTNATFLVGNVDDESKRLVQVTRECLEKGIGAVRPGRPVSDIGAAIESHAQQHGMSVVRAYCGHGIGELFHSGLQIPHYFDPTANHVMEPGLTFTIEPMISLGTWRHVLWDDGWTSVTADGRRSAQFEHTVLVTETGAEVLTLPPSR